MNISSSDKRYLLVSAVYFFFLLAILLIFGYTPTNDGNAYIEMADICIRERQPYPCLSLIKGYPFVWNIGSINLIALSILLFHSTYPILILMCLLKASSAFLLAKIAETLFNEKTACVALLVFITYPNNYGQSTTLLSEIPSIFLALLAVSLLLKKHKSYVFVISGSVLFLSNWFRPITLVFIVSLFLYFLLINRSALIRRFLPMIAGYCLALLLFGSETYIRTGYFVYKGDSLWFNVCDDAYDGAEIRPHWNQETFQKGTPRYIENMDELDCFQCADIWKERCLAWIMDHKLEWLKKIPYRVVYMYYNDIDNMSFCLKEKSVAENNFITLPYRNIVHEANNLSAPQWAAIACSLYYWLLMILFLFSSFLLLIRKQWKSLALPLLIIVIGTLAITFVMHGETRFKAPYMPYIIMVAAYSIACPIKKHLYKHNCS